MLPSEPGAKMKNQRGRLLGKAELPELAARAGTYKGKHEGPFFNCLPDISWLQVSGLWKAMWGWQCVGPGTMHL